MSVLFVEETRESLEKTTDLPQVTVKLDHIMLNRVHFVIDRVRTHNFLVIGTDCTGRYKSMLHVRQYCSALYIISFLHQIVTLWISS
jgi:hypothetical protein